MRVNAGGREVAENQTQPIPQPGLEGFDPWLGSRALEDMIIPVFHEGNGRRRWPLDVIAFAHGIGQQGSLGFGIGCIGHGATVSIQGNAHAISATGAGSSRGS